MRPISFHTTRASIFALTLGLGSAVGASGALAQQDAPSFGIEEITVTAQRREESLQDIPIAVTAIGGATLREDEIASLQDIGNRTPGMVFAAFSPGQPEIAIRGIGTKEDGASASDSTVVSVDDVYIAARTAQVFDIFDLERVEVLRGPQGTLYGKNSIGGSINFVTSKPSDEFIVRLRQTIGNYDRFDTGGMVSGPISDTVSGKFAFSRRKHDGYLTNVLQGSEFFGEQQGESNTFSWRAQTVWTPSERWEVTITADGADDSYGASNREPVGGIRVSGNGDNFDPIAVNEALGGAGDPWTSLAETEGCMDREIGGVSLKVDYDFDFATLTSISAYRESDFDWLEDSEGLPPASAPPFSPPETGFFLDVNDAAVEKVEQYTQELRLTSSGVSDLEWVGGLFFSKEDFERSERFTFTSFPSDQVSIQENETNSFAAYGQATYDFTPELSLTGGVRYSYEKKEMTAEGRVLEGGAILLQDFGPVPAEEDWNNVSFRVALDWKPTDDALLYALISTGFKSGGFTGSASSAERATTPFDPEKAINYEVGAKTTWFDRRLLVNLTAFYTDYQDLQVTRFFRPVGNLFGEFITENASDAKLKGIEVEFTAQPVEGLELGGNYAYLDAIYKNFLPQTPSDDGAGNPVFPDFSGNQLRQAPKHSLSAYVRYEWQLSEDMGSVYGKVNFRYQSRSFYDPDENPISVIPAYEIWDARVGYLSPERQWELSAWIKNIGSEQYRTHVFTQRGGDIAFAVFGDPETYGLTLTYNY